MSLYREVFPIYDAYYTKLIVINQINIRSDVYHTTQVSSRIEFYLLCLKLLCSMVFFKVVTNYKPKWRTEQSTYLG
jgi:hypothetical protein